MLHLSLLALRCSAGPWDGSNITYGRHHAVTEQLLSPGTNNSVAMSLIKRNGTNYGPILVRAIMYCSALAWPQPPAQTSTDREGNWVQSCGSAEEHTERSGACGKPDPPDPAASDA